MFVEIKFDASHLIATVKQNFDPASNIALLGTIQFTNVVYSAYQSLKEHFPSISIPQSKPLSKGMYNQSINPRMVYGAWCMVYGAWCYNSS